MESADNRYQDLIDKLKTRGYRITPQRELIIRVIVASPDHPSAEMIYERVKAVFPMTSLATIYKTIHILKEQAEILELAFTSGGNRFDAARPGPHPHLICVNCQKIVDPDLDLFRTITREILDHYGFQINHTRMDIYGLCETCRGSAQAIPA
jgi:Fur family transcriptional regulator, peroxide stress response regulator